VTSLTADRPATAAHHAPRGPGERLLEAVTAFESFPVLAYARDRMLRCLDSPGSTPVEAADVIESDPALTIGLLRLADRENAGGGRSVSGVLDALTVVRPSSLRRFVAAAPTFDTLGGGDGWSAAARWFRPHALATTQAAERLIAAGLAQDPDAVRAGALLHDCGKVVLLHAYGRVTAGGEDTPMARVRAERDKWGLDHAVLGGLLARRLGLPRQVAVLIEQHHSATATGDAALVRLADALAHCSVGDPVDRGELADIAARVGLGPQELDAAVYGPVAGSSRPRRAEPSPLSRQQTAVLEGLAEGLRYKQIALQLGLAPSTVRSHMQSAYMKLGVCDRAQAVLVARDRGWV
jgi:putative nucleotidyltransferase with HDIG domain